MFALTKKEFSKFYDKYVESIYRFIFLRVNSRETAEDLTSQAFLKFWEAREKIKDKRAFLYQIARNLVIDFYRQKQKATIPIEEVSFAISDEKENFEIKLIQASQIEEIKNALSKITPEYSEAIILRYLDDLPFSEIARILERPEGTVRVMVHRGLAELRQLLNMNNN